MNENEVVDNIIDGEAKIEEATGTVEGEGILYTSTEVGNMLGLTADMVRYYAEKFPEYIEIKTVSDKKKSPTRYSPEDVEILRHIVELTKEGRRVKEIKNILQNPDSHYIYEVKTLVSKQFEEMLANSHQQFAETTMKAMKEFADSLSRTIESQQKLLIEDVEQKNQQQKEMAERLEKIESAYSTLQEQHTEVLRQYEEIKDLAIQLIEKQDEKKGLIGRLFGKK